MEYDLGLRKDMKYLVGASGGSDSMTLLSLCLSQGYQVVVAHVNYKLRANADKEEQLLKQYCLGNNVTVYTLYPKQKDKQNFQSWAREARYQFYKEIYDKEGCDCLLLGHQKDDHIESYLMAKERGSHGWYYGIKRETELYGMKVSRPLLSLRKKETRQYCLDHNVPFGDDESNFSDKYFRNRIRHTMVEPASEQQIEQWLKEIDELNQRIDNDLKEISQHYDFSKDISIQQFNQEKKRIKALIIRRYFWENGYKEMLSSDYVNEIILRLQMDKTGNGTIDINEQNIFVYEYGVYYISKRKDDFCYVLENIEYLKNEYFSLSESGKTIEGVTLQKSDFPIKIRNYKEGDSIQLRFGTKKVNRFFIDRKIPLKERICWPVIENSQGEVVFVADIGCDVYHYSIKPNLFMIK